MTNDCKRWAELSDRWALEEDLSELETEFCRLHASSCALCAAEQRVWADLGACLEGQAAASGEHSAESGASLLASEAAARRRPQPLMWAGGLGIAVAAGLLIFSFRFAGQAETTPLRVASKQTTNTRTFAQILLVSGDVALGGSKPSAGASLDKADTIVTGAGRACLTHGEGTTTCLEKHSRGRVLEARSGVQRLDLSGGTLYCKQPPGAFGVPFEVKTKWGTIAGFGAEFITAYAVDGSVLIDPLRGQVRVRHSGGAEQTYSGPGSVRLDAVGVSRTTLPGVSPDVAPYRQVGLWEQASLTPVFIGSEPLGAVVTVDGVSGGMTPLSMMVGRGAYELEISLDGFASQRRTLEVKGAERVTETFALEQLDRGEEKLSKLPGPAAVEPSAAELLARAQTHREKGRFGEAARVYQTILARYPASGEAAATRLSLGELQLSQLGAPAAALASFRQYLQGGGALRQEARYGEIRALRALGRDDEARSLARKFSALYPQSGQAVSLLRWLQSSEKKAPAR